MSEANKVIKLSTGSSVVSAPSDSLEPKVKLVALIESLELEKSKRSDQKVITSLSLYINSYLN